MGDEKYDIKDAVKQEMSMTKDQIRLREAAEKFFELLPSSLDGANEFRLCEMHGDFWVPSADGDFCDIRDESPVAKAFVDFLVAARDAGLDKEGTFERYAEERERRREIGKTIDPATAEVRYCYSIDVDPYDMIPLFAWREECDSQSERTMFARSPGGEWVVREDLPDKTYGALRARGDRWGANGCIDIILDVMEKVIKAEGARPWFAPAYEPCDIGVRVNIESHDGAKAAIEFSPDDPQAHLAVKEQLAAFLEANFEGAAVA